MTTYTLWSGSLPSGTTSTAGGTRTDGLQFTVTQSGCQCTGAWYYVPSGEATLTGSSYAATLWSTTDGISGTQLATANGTGTFTAGAWNFIQFASPVTLSTGTTYMAGIYSPDLLQFVHNYWTSGGSGQSGITSGPISAPSFNAALNNAQQSNINSNAFPVSSTGTWYGVDISVTTSNTSTVTVSDYAGAVESLIVGIPVHVSDFAAGLDVESVVSHVAVSDFAAALDAALHTAMQTDANRILPAIVFMAGAYH